MIVQACGCSLASSMFGVLTLCSVSHCVYQILLFVCTLLFQIYCNKNCNHLWRSNFVKLWPELFSLCCTRQPSHMCAGFGLAKRSDSLRRSCFLCLIAGVGLFLPTCAHGTVMRSWKCYLVKTFLAGCGECSLSLLGRRVLVLILCHDWLSW